MPDRQTDEFELGIIYPEMTYGEKKMLSCLFTSDIDELELESLSRS